MELLVVIGIIAALISILLPTLNRVRRAAASTACLSNLRQLGQAMLAYTTDNKGYIIPAGYSTVLSPGVTQDEMWAQILVAAHYVPNPNISASSTIPCVQSIFCCPANPGNALNGLLPSSPIDPKIAMGRYHAGWSQTDSQTSATPTGLGALSTSRIVIHNWYYINGTLNCPIITGWRAPLPCKWIPGNIGTSGAPIFDWSLNKMSKMRRTSELVWLADGMSWQGDRDANFINGRHGNTRDLQSAVTNILFFDGHAASELRINLPQNSAAAVSEISLSGAALSQKHQSPIWRMDQF